MTHRPFVLIFLVLSAASAKIYKKCELAKELKYKYDFDAKQIPVWVCIAKHESDFNTSAVNRGSGDHGLFQISDLYWCHTERKGRACSANCKDFEDDDISDDVGCVKTIYEEHERISGDGFDAWVVYPHFCKNKNSTYLHDCSYQVDTTKSLVDLRNSTFTRRGASVSEEGNDSSSPNTVENKGNGTPSPLVSRTSTPKPTQSPPIQPTSSILHLPRKKLFTSLGYYILDTTTGRSSGKLESSTSINSVSSFTSFPRKYTPSTSMRSPLSKAVKHPESRSHKHYGLVGEQEPVKLRLSGYTLNGKTPQFRQVRREKATSNHRDYKSLRSRDEEIVQEIKFGDMYTFQRTRGGGFQLRLI